MLQGFCPYGEHNRMADILFKTPEGGLHAMLHGAVGKAGRSDDVITIWWRHDAEAFSIIDPLWWESPRRCFPHI